MNQESQEQVVIIVGAGPAGLATAACLTKQSVPHILLEREDCYAPLWFKKTYDRLHLHLPKHICQLPLLPFPSNYPTYVSKPQFLSYFDNYVSHFNITPLFNRSVELANFDNTIGKWYVKVKNSASGEVEEYRCRFLVVATGETTDPFVPEVDGIKSFGGEFIHSTQYKNGKVYEGKNVLVVGSGNSGMEIALDLANHRAKASIVIRSPSQVDICGKQTQSSAMKFMKFLTAMNPYSTKYSTNRMHYACKHTNLFLNPVNLHLKSIRLR